MQTTARHAQGVPCAAGCGVLAAAGHIYCRGCLDAPVPLVEPSDDLDLDVLLLREKLAGGGRLTRRLTRYGRGHCMRCPQPTLRGRMYCSERCRWHARRGDFATIELDGVRARPAEHAARLGIGRSTFYRRLQLGLTPEQALRRPIDVAMRQRFAGVGEGETRWPNSTS